MPFKPVLHLPEWESGAHVACDSLLTQTLHRSEAVTPLCLRTAAAGRRGKGGPRASAHKGSGAVAFNASPALGWRLTAGRLAGC